MHMVRIAKTNKMHKLSNTRGSKDCVSKSLIHDRPPSSSSSLSTPSDSPFSLFSRSANSWAYMYMAIDLIESRGPRHTLEQTKSEDTTRSSPRLFVSYARSKYAHKPWNSWLVAFAATLAPEQNKSLCMKRVGTILGRFRAHPLCLYIQRC